MLKMYDIKIDDFREVTQEDIDRLTYAMAIYGAALSHIKQSNGRGAGTAAKAIKMVTLWTPGTEHEIPRDWR